MTSTQGIDTMRAQWESELLLGGVAEASSVGTDLSDAVHGFVIDYTLPDGTITEGNVRPLGHLNAGQVFTPPAVDDSAIKAWATEILTRYGLTGTNVEVLHPLDAAIAVSATIDPATFGPHLNDLEGELTGGLHAFEACWIALDLPDGTPVVRIGADFRNGGGAQYVLPSASAALGVPSRSPG